MAEKYLLSPQQTHLWLLQKAERSNRFNGYVVAELTGSIVEARLQKALSEVQQRNEILRTCFNPQPGMRLPVQLVKDQMPLWLECLDWRELGEGRAREKLIDLLEQDDFDMEEGPVVHTRLIQRSEHSHLLAISMPAMCGDSRAHHNMVAEIIQAYLGQEPDMEPVNYAAAAEWYNELLESEDSADGRAFWRSFEVGDAMAQRLYIERHAEDGTKFIPRVTSKMFLERATTQVIEQVVADRECSPFLFLLTCWYTVLWRVSKDTRMVVGVGFDGRSNEDLLGALGLFERFLPMAAQMNEQMNIHQLMDQIMSHFEETYVWQDCFTWQDFLDLETGEFTPHHFPLCFEYHDTPLLIDAEGLKVTIREWDVNSGRFGIKLTAVRSDSGIQVCLHYDETYYRHGDVACLLDAYVHVLNEVAKYPARPLAMFSLLSDDEKTRILQLANTGEKCSYDHEPPVFLTIDQMAERFPEKVAVAFEGRQISYRQLKQQSDFIAATLRAKNVSTETFVGLYIDRCLEMVTGLLGILKAGCIYMPMDSAYPKERLHFMLDQTKTALILTNRQLQDNLNLFHADILLFEDLDLDHAVSMPLCEINGDHLAYLIFTSGSTGLPKGVMISHDALARHTRACIEYYKLTDGDKMLQFSSFNFDASLEQIIPPLMVGATLRVRPDTIWDGNEMLSRILDEQLTVVNYPTAYWHTLAHEWRGKHLDSESKLRLVIVGGEAMHAQGVTDWHATPFANVRLLNAYGPTEATITATVHEVPAHDEDQNERVAIGRAFPNRDAIIVDQFMTPMPLNIPGQLWLGGECLARGYHNAPGLTASRFIPNPFSDKPGARVYPSGDMARYLDDGCIQFLGRKDQQVKIRGFRIELGEIEHVLNRHPAVKLALVAAMLVPADSQDLQLVAYLEPQSSDLDLGNLKQDLQNTLPEHLIPSLFVVLDAVPYLPNGKIDRQALPDPGSVLTPVEHGNHRLTHIEEILSGIWCELLNVEEVSPVDNFMDLGGHSLMAMRLVGRIRDVMGVSIPLRDIFNDPKLASVARRIEQVKREDGLEEPPLVAGERTGPLPLTYAQQRLWFLDRLQSGSSAYNISGAFRFKGNTNIDALEQTMKEIVKRHHLINARFSTVNDQPVQYITPLENWSLYVKDLSLLPSEERETRCREEIVALTAKPFDLARPPLLHCLLVKLATDECALAISMHHIISDGWSIGVLTEEVVTLYRAFCKGEPNPLQPLSLQYSDYALWQQGWLKGDVLASHIAFWKKHLEGGNFVLDLPTTYPRPQKESYNGQSLAYQMPANLVLDLRDLARKAQCSLYMVLLGSFNLLLSRYTGQEDIIVGTATANREKKEVESLIGLFVNTLALRTNMTDNPSFRGLLERVRAVTLDGFAHQNMPFEQLIQVLDPDRDLSRSPLFQAMLVLQNTPVHELAFDDFSVTPYEFEPGISKFDMTLAIGDDAHLSSSFEYNTDLFSPQWANRFLEHYNNLLVSIVNNPELPIQNHQVLSKMEQTHMLLDWNNTEKPLPTALPTEQFQNIVATMPDRIAIRDQGSQVTYRELDHYSNRLAVKLRKLGVGPDKIVAVLANRSLNTIAAYLGIFKAGGAYLPVAPEFPHERVKFMLEDTGAEIVLFNGTAPEFDFGGDYQFLNLAEVFSGDDQTCLALPTPNVAGANLAYTIFTSGSTGKPKAVGVCLTSIIDLVEDSKDFEVGAEGVMAHCINTAFDLATSEIWMGLLRGWRIAVVPEDLLLSATDLAKFLRNESVSIMVASTAIVNYLSLEVPTLFQSLKYLLFGGEAADPTRIRALLAQGAPANLVNVYGPSEATSYCSRFTIESLDNDAHTVSIGFPVTNTSLYILDRYLNPVPAGSVGELYVSGFGLARCYYNRPSQTAQSFVPNPFSKESGDRLYRTGDLVYYDTTRKVEPLSINFMGRRDHQVKMRGYRIELGEIENAISALDLVKDNRVLMIDPAFGNKVLVAYVATEDGSSLNDISVRTALLKRLPDYMVPETFFYLDKLPIKSTGKIDHGALKAMYGDRPQGGIGALRTPTQEIMANIWCEILNVPKIGSRDNFFKLGGHSLLATHVVSQIGRHFEVTLPLASIFSAPDLEALCQEVDRLMNDVDRVNPPPIVPVSRSEKLPLSFSQQRLWFLDQIRPRTANFNVSQGLRFEGRFCLDVMTRTVETIVARHESLRTKFVSAAGEAAQVVEPAYPPTLPFEDLSAMAQEEQERAVNQFVDREINQVFNLAEGRLWHLQILKLSDDVHVCLLTMHHIIADGWSNNIFLSELTSLYHAYDQNLSSPLLPLKVGYPDYAHWQRNWLKGEVLESELGYWKSALADMPPTTELPFDRPRPQASTHRGFNHKIDWDKELSDALQTLSREQGATLFMTMLSAFGLMLHYYSDQKAIVVGTDVANRDRFEVKDLIGFFINQVPIPLRFEGEDSLIAQLQKTKKSTLGALAYQDVPFEAVVNKVQTQRTMAHAPLFQNKLFLLHEKEEHIELPELNITGLPMEITEARIDMTMGLWATSSGITGLLNFSLDLFNPETTQRMIATMERILRSMASEPRVSIAALFTRLREEGKAAKAEALQQREASKLEKFKKGDRSRRGRSAPVVSPVEFGVLAEGQSLPLLISAGSQGANLEHWLQHKQELVSEKLHEHGAILFRGFGMDQVPQFRAFAETVCHEVYQENAEHRPISNDGKIAVPVEYDAGEKLLWHNENSFNQTWPFKIIFGAALPARVGGETTLVDSRLMFDRLPEALKKPFLEKGVLYERNFNDFIGIKWQAIFGTDDPKVLEQRCREKNFTFKWREDGGLTTWAKRPAAIPHPVTAVMSWFNQAQHWHIACLSPVIRAEVMASFKETNRPRNCYYGDGSKIDDSVMEEILALYQELEVCFPWEKGDVMLIDNVLTAHARNPYEGERRLLVAMGDLMNFSEIKIHGEDQ